MTMGDFYERLLQVTLSCEVGQKRVNTALLQSFVSSYECLSNLCSERSPFVQLLMLWTPVGV